MGRPARVLAIGWFGERNLGDEAMLEGLRAVLERTLGSVALRVMSADPAATRASHGVEAIPLPPTERAGFRNLSMVRAALWAELVTLGGGDLIRETRGALAPARFWLRRLRVAQALRRPTAVVGVSVGALQDRATRDETVRRLRDVSLIAVRDEASADRLVELGLDRPHLIGDLALEAPLGAIAPRPTARERPRIGVVTRELVRRGPDLDAGAGAALEASLAGALDGLVDGDGAQIRVIPFRTRPKRELRDDDRSAADSLAAAARTGGTWSVEASPTSAAGFAALTADLDAIVSVRLHGAVLGAAAGVPVVGIAYDPKVRGFLDSIGIPEQCVALDAGAAELERVIRGTLTDPTLPVRTAAGVHAARERTEAFGGVLAGLVRGGRPSLAIPAVRRS